MDSSNINTDELIENLEKRLSEMYEKGEEKSTNQVFNIEPTKPIVESPVVTPKSNLFLLILTPIVVSAILYFVKPKSVKKGSKIDKFKFTRMVFIVSFVLWILIMLNLK
jgi:hypothetical protein